MNNPKISFHLWGFIRVEIQQRETGRWSLRMINEHDQREETVYRSLSTRELKELTKKLIDKTNDKVNKEGSEEERFKAFKEEIKNLIKGQREHRS